jgi:gliding motility-associated-like protein
MTRLKYIGTAILLLCIGLTGSAQNISNKGKEFWVGYGHHQFMENGTNTQEMTIYLSTEDQPATVTVTIDSSAALPALWWKRTYIIPPYTVIDLETTPANSFQPFSAGATGAIPKTGSQDARLFTDPPPAGTGGAGTFRKRGIHIESNVPIVAYAHIYGVTSTGATMLLPVEAWGYSYVSLNSEQNYGNDCYNWMYVIAMKDNTVIEITPSVKTRAQDRTGLQPGVTKTITLMKGQIYQVIGANTNSNADGNSGPAYPGFPGVSTGLNLSGTKVRSLAGVTGECYPIAVFAGSSRTSNPASCGSGGGDNDNQQLFPQHAWGKRYLTVPFSGSSTPSSFATCTYKVAVMDPSTIVKKNGVQIAGLQNGNFYVFESSTANLIEADKPIMVTQFMTGGGCLGAGGLGDPEMVVVAPIEQAIKSVGFYRNTKYDIDVNYVTLTVPNTGTGLSSLRIDGSNVFDLVIPHPANGQPGLLGRTYSIVVKRWAAAKAQALIKGDSAFNAITYGLGSVESYAYSAGAFVNNLNYLNGLHNIPDTTNGGHNYNDFTGANTPAKMGILMRYMPTKLTFKFSAWPTTPAPGIVTPLNDGIAPEVTAGVDFVMNPPSDYFVDSPVINGVKYYWYQLPDSFRFNVVGTHNLPVVAESPGIDNCGNKEYLTLTFDVKAQPVANATIAHITKCTKDDINLNGPATALSGSVTFNLNQWLWTIKQGTTTINTFTTRLATTKLPPGTYTITLNAITVHGLIVTPLSYNITVYAAPTATFFANPDTLCLGQSTTFSQASSYSGPSAINYYSWNLDDGSPGTSGTWANKIKTYPAFGTYRAYLVAGVSPTCISDTAWKTVVVSGAAHPVSITPPSGCLTGGVGNFQASSTAQGGTVITNYSWNFGDPSTGSNNTSNQQNPSHTFSAPGVFQVILNITTATGCMGSDTLTVNANIKPQLTWSNSNPANFDTVCQTSPPISLAFGTVTNGIPGKPKYTDTRNAIDSAGMFNPQLAGPGRDTIHFTFTSDSGCVITIDTFIVVSARPAKPLVTTPVNYCQGDASSPLNATALPGHTLTWYSDAALTTAIPTPIPLTNTAGTTKYYVTQVKDGCASEADTITVNVTPSISNNVIAADQTICEGSPAATLATSGTVSGGTGTYTYQWQSSTDGGTIWNDVAGANETYNPGNGTVTTKYRRKINSGLCSNTSNVITITVVPAITNYQVTPTTQNVCENILPANLDGQTPGGAGTFAYQWQSSPDNAVWTDIAGATNEDYQFSAALTATTYFRRKTVNGPCTVTSASVVVNLKLNANGAISTTTPAICEYQAADISFVSSAGTAPFSITYTLTNPSGTSTPVTQNGVANNATFNVIPAGSAPGNYTITFNSITNSNTCIKSTGLNTVSITVNPRPVVTINPVAAVCEGTTITLTANGANTYNWTGPNLVANTGSSVSATPPPGTPHYDVTGTLNGCNSISVGIDVTINPRPAKPTVTSPVTYCQDAPASPLAANGAAGNTIKWYTNPGLTGGTTTPPTPSTATAGTTTYYVTQTNSGGCESEAETITVTITPSIANNNLTPATQDICSGSVPAITAPTPTGGTGTYTYQWQSSPDGSTWTNIAGETNATYTAPALTATIRYRRIVNSGLCSNTSSPVVVNVTPALGNNTIGTSHNVCEGLQSNQLTGSVPTGGTGSYTYQWQSSPDGSTWTDIAGAINADYPSTTPAATTHYRRKVTSGPCSVISAAIIVTIIPNANGSIAAQDADICQYEAGNIVFTASAGTAPFTINYTITAPGGGTTTSNLSVNSGAVINVVPTGSAAGTYTITLNSITNSNGCVKTGGFTPVTITVTATPVVSIAPVSPVCIGGTVTLTANGAATYTWSGTGANLSSTTGTSVTATPATAGTYPLTVQGVTNGCNSNTANIDVVINPRPVAPTVTSPLDYCQLGAASPLTGSGAAGNTITWYNNAGLTGGVTTAPTPSTTNAGSFTYYVTQTNSFSCESVPATITINVAPGLGGNQIGSEQTICQGNTPAPLTNIGTITGGNGTYSYQWQVSTDGVNFTDIPGATLPGYSPGILNDTTWYRRNVTSTLCGSVSNIVRINVFEGLGNYGISANQTICENTAPVSLDGQSPTGTGPFTFTWEQSTNNGATWTTAIGSSNAEDYSPLALATTTWYHRKVTNGPCTATSNDVIITVNPVANGNITAPSAICEYQSASITFNATVGTGTFVIQYNITAPGGSVTPSGPVNVTNGSSLNVIPTGSAPGVYTIMLTSIQGSNGCIRTSGLNSVNITVNPRPSVTINPVTAICEGQSKDITANGASTYAWSGGLTGATINVTPAVTTTYQVVGTALGCESNPVSAVLTVNPKPNASFTIADDVICLNETASFTNNSTIDSGSIATLTWDFDNSNVQTIPYSTSPITQTYSTHRIYNVKLTATSDKGCVSDVFTLPISVNPLPVASFNNPAFVCMPNGIATFQNTTTIANGAPVTYTWTFGDPGSGAANTSNNVNGSHVYPDSASYNITLLAVSAQGCSNQVSQSFNTFFNKPVAKFGVTPDTLCQGIQNAFFDSSFAPGSTIDTRLWTFGDGTTSADASPTKTYAHPGNYNVKLQVSNAQGCTAEVNKSIVVYLQPVVDAGPSFIVAEGTTVTFNAQTNSGALALAWTSPTGGVLNDPSLLKPSYIANQDGIFVLTATGDGNCSATDTLTVKILRPVKIPNAFSPNGDGVNDTWGITNLGDYPNAVVEVFNRYGQPVFKQYGYSKPWDGKLNGKDLPVGTYYYIIEPKSGFPGFTGYVVIVR